MEHVYEEKDHIRLSRCLFFSFYRGSHICRDHSDPAEGNAGKFISQQMKAAPEKQPKKEKAKKKKDKKNKKENKKKENKEASPISQMDEPWIEVGLTSGMRLSLTGLEACRGTVDGKTVSTYRKGRSSPSHAQGR